MKIKLLAGLSTLALLSSCLVACGGDPSKGGKSENPADYYEKPTEGERAFSEVTTFDAPVEFHTEKQKAFLEYDEKPYEDVTGDEMTKWSGGDNEDISQPVPVEIEFSQDSADVEKYTLEISRDYKFENDVISMDIDANSNKFDVYNLYSGTDYYYKVKAIYGEDDYAVSATNKLTTVAGIRNLYIEGMTNCRDMGGKPTLDGRYMKQGLLYRTAAMDDNQSGSIITEAGKVRMLNEFKMKTELELRGGSNGLDKGEAKNRTNSVLGDSVNYAFKGMAYSGGKNLLFRNVEIVRQVFDVLGDADNYPVFFHCRIGTDRTGLVAFLVNALCGVDVQLLYQDYLMSNFGKIGKHFGCKGNGEDTVFGYINEINDFPGDTLQQSCYNFLLTAGVEAEKLDTVISTLVEGEKLDASRVYVANEADMQDVGAPARVQKKNLRQPDEAVKMASVGDGVKYTFTSDKEFTCDLYANLMSNYTSGTLSDNVSVKLNNEEIEVPATSLATSALGFDSSLEAWIPAKLGSITVPSGENTLELTIKSNFGGKGLQFTQFAFSGMSVAANIQ